MRKNYNIMVILLVLFNFIWMCAANNNISNIVDSIDIEPQTNCSNCTGGHAMQRPRPLVVDLVIYNGEPILQFRLEYLRSVVDIFIIVEAKMTFSGLKKLHYDLDRTNYTILRTLREEGKVLEVRLDELRLPDTFDHQSRRGRNATIDAAWWREKYLRDSALGAVRNVTAGRRFVLMVTDLDEIPRKDYVSLFPDVYGSLGAGLRLEMASFIYSFRWRLSIKGNSKWPKSFIITDASFAKSNWLLSLDDLRHSLPAVYFQDAGWHCSFCLTVDLLIRKFQSFSHMELNTPRNTNPTWLADCIQDGRDLLRREVVAISEYECDTSPRLPVCTSAECPSVQQLPYLHLQRCSYDDQEPQLTASELLHRRTQIK